MPLFNDALDWNNLVAGAGSLADLWGGLRGAGTANQVNQGVQQNLTQNNAATQAQIDALNNQINTNRQQAQDMYQRSLGDVTAQNQGLQGNIDTMTSNLNALSDPNSPYMQMARQAIERKDAAAGRNSQWGERETQLAGTLADLVSSRSPAMQQAISAARGQISQNNQGLASLYSTANAPADRNTMAQLAALQQQLQNSTTMNTTGRQAANSATNNMTGAIKGGVGALGSLGRLFGLAGASSGSGITDYFNPSGSSITGYGSSIGDLYGAGLGGSGQGFGAAMSPYDSYNMTIGSMSPSGYGNMPAADYFGGGGLGGVPTGGYSMPDTGYSDVPNNIDDWSFWS